MAGMFFLPFGYDILFKTILDYTNSYATTDSIFYGISFVFLVTHIYISQKNPIDEINQRALDTKLKIMDLRSKI